MARRYLRVAALALGAVVYLWLAAVRRSDAVKAKKAGRREAARRARS